jgi:hypothetical protein
MELGSEQYLGNTAINLLERRLQSHFSGLGTSERDETVAFRALQIGVKDDGGCTQQTIKLHVQMSDRETQQTFFDFTVFAERGAEGVAGGRVVQRANKQLATTRVLNDREKKRRE